MDEATLVVAYASSVLGAVGALFFIVSYVGFEDLRTKSRQLLLFLSLADLGQAIRFLTLRLDWTSEATCTFQSLFGIWVATASFFWTACIAVYVYLVVKNPNRLFPAWGYRLFHIICWGYPTIFVLVVLIVDPTITRGSDVPWCFLDPRSNVAWRVMGYALPLVGCWLVTAVMYVMASWHVTQGAHFIPHTADRNSPHELEMRELQTKFKLIPCAFLLLRVWDAAYHTYTALFHSVQPLAGWYLQVMVFGDASQGFFNCLIFVLLTRKIRARVLAGLSLPWPAPHGGERERLVRKSTYYTENL
eukprot:EG_transcript_12476